MLEEKKRLPSVNETLEQAIQERYFNVIGLKVLENKGYTEALNKLDEVINKITSLLPEEKDLHTEILLAATRPEDIKAKIMYRQGLRDGLALRPAWGGVR